MVSSFTEADVRLEKSLYFCRKIQKNPVMQFFTMQLLSGMIFDEHWTLELS
jgi:hypothetical protein